MVVKGSKRSECCSYGANLPEEMEESLGKLGGMEKLKKSVPTKEQLVPESRIFNALSDPIRLQILHTLLVVDLCPCVIKDITELSDSKLSYHLNILETAGLITSSPRKRWRVYMVTKEGRALIKS